MSSSPLILDTAIIGGGIAGTYAAWRLQNQPNAPKIGLFEYSNRIGGKLLSRALPGMPHVIAELGGMRYIPDTQPLVTGLIEHLGLPNAIFPMGEAEPSLNYPASDNYYYLRGKQIKASALGNEGAIPYNVSWQEAGKNPDELQKAIMDLYVPNATNLSFEDWFKVSVFGKFLYQQGYWNFLSQVLSNEAFQFMRDAGGYDANVANASTIAQLPVSDFGIETNFRRLTQGYQSLPITLAQQFETAGGQVLMNKRLKSIVKQPDGSFKLRFITTVTVNSKTKDAEPLEETIVLAKKVVLAMPRRSLELIDWQRFKTNAFLKRNLKSVLIQHAFKIFLAYQYPWWRSLNLWSGRSITDLQIRQTYYFGVESESGGEANNSHALLMASYNDISTTPYWKGFENDAPYEGTAYSTQKNLTASPDDYEYQATQGMVDAAHRQVLEMHNLKTLDKPYSAVFHDWSGNPFGGGWHEWKAGYRYDQIIPQMVKPVEEDEVYIIGEAYSNNQGWVEGALETANDLINRFFNLSFLPSNG
jgi:lysine 2-monooxygenase